MPTINYSAEALWGNRGEGTASINLTSGSSYTFGITSSFQGYFTMETVRNYQGFYDNTSPQNLSGTFSSFNNIITTVSSSYIAGFVPNPGFSSFVFTPNANVNGYTLYLRGTGDVSLGITETSPTPSVVTNFSYGYYTPTGSVNWQLKTPGEVKCDYLYATVSPPPGVGVVGENLNSYATPTIGTQMYSFNGNIYTGTGMFVVNNTFVYELAAGIIIDTKSFASLPACV
jgi:hypothetical protein